MDDDGRDPDEVAGLRAVAWELYGLQPSEFTAARTAAAKRLRADGDRAVAARVTALRRPPLAAWAVNLLARERTELVAEISELGTALRQAQSLLQGDALRDLARQRRRLVAAVTTEVLGLARERGQVLGDASTRQVEATLQAAMTDGAAAEAVRSGLLAQPLTSTGLESLAEVLAVPPDAPDPAPGSRSPSSGDTGGQVAERPALSLVRDEDREREQAHLRVDAAGRTLRKAVKARDKAVRSRTKREARVLQLEAGLEELRRQLAEAEAATEAASAALADVDARVEAREAEVAQAREVAASAAAELARLTGPRATR